MVAHPNLHTYMQRDRYTEKELLSFILTERGWKEEKKIASTRIYVILLHIRMETEKKHVKIRFQYDLNKRMHTYASVSTRAQLLIAVHARVFWFILLVVLFCISLFFFGYIRNHASSKGKYCHFLVRFFWYTISLTLFSAYHIAATVIS